MNVIVQGQLINIFKTADFTNKETGEVKEGKVKLQLMCQTVLNNNQKKMSYLILLFLVIN